MPHPQLQYAQMFYSGRDQHQWAPERQPSFLSSSSGDMPCSLELLVLKLTRPSLSKKAQLERGSLDREDQLISCLQNHSLLGGNRVRAKGHLTLPRCFLNEKYKVCTQSCFLTDPWKKKSGILTIPLKIPKMGPEENFSFWTMTEKGILMNILAHRCHFLALSGPKSSGS